MRISIAGMAAQIFILFISLIILPIYFMSIIQYYKDVNRIQTAERNFVDYVIDNRQVTDAALSDLNISMAGVTTPINVEVKRQVRIINPSLDTDNTNEVSITWVYADWDEDTIWLQGDLVEVVAHQEATNVMQQISGAFLGSVYNNLDMRLVGMVR